MNNKLLVLVYVPLLEKEYTVFIPVNKKIGTVRNNIIETVMELSEGNFQQKNNLLYDSSTNTIFDHDIYVKNSTITNGTKLILL